MWGNIKKKSLEKNMDLDLPDSHEKIVSKTVAKCFLFTEWLPLSEKGSIYCQQPADGTNS